jgi:hypothetical protein
MAGVKNAVARPTSFYESSPLLFPCRPQLVCYTFSMSLDSMLVFRSFPKPARTGFSPSPVTGVGAAALLKKPSKEELWHSEELARSF